MFLKAKCDKFGQVGSKNVILKERKNELMNNEYLECRNKIPTYNAKGLTKRLRMRYLKDSATAQMMMIMMMKIMRAKRFELLAATTLVINSPLTGNLRFR